MEFFTIPRMLCRKTFWKTANAGDLPTTSHLYWTHNLKIGRLVFDKSKKILQTTSKGAITFCVKKLGVVAYALQILTNRYKFWEKIIS